MMTTIESLLQQPAAQVIGWALLHFVWQGALIGGLTAIALGLLRRSGADVRYVVATIALSLMVTLPAVTAVQLWRGNSTEAGAPEWKAASIPSTSVSSTGPAVKPPRQETWDSGPTLSPRFAIAAPAAWSGVLEAVRLEPWLPAVVLGWLCGVAVLTLRLLSGCLWVRRLKSHGTVPAAEGWQHTAARLSRRLHITRRIRLFESALVDVPTVIGWIKPVVLLPASALAGLSPQQIEAILMHELAHIRRHDYVVNLLQTLVETLLFYHPAVWWLSRRIRAERENCCDDLAVSLCGDPFAYAAALADLEELRGGTRHGEFLAMAASGGSGSSLVHRVRRLLGAPTHAGRAPGWLAGSATILLLVGVMAGAAGTDAFQSLHPSTPPQAASAPPQASSPKPPAEPLSPQELVATTRALEAGAKALAKELKFSWDAALDGARRNKAQAGMEQRARDLAAAVAESQADTTRRAQERARAMAERAQTPQVAALADATRALVAIDAATTAMATQSEFLLAAAVTAQSDALSAATTAAVALSAGFHSGGGQKSGDFSWSNNGEKLEVKYRGEIEFTDDDADVKTLSPGGSLRIRDGGWFASHTVVFTADAAGNLTRRFWAGSTERPFDPEGRQWLAKMLPRFIRQTGIAAPARVARIFKSKGAAGVLAEISLVEGSWSKRIYFREMLKTPLDAATVRQILVQAGREIDSDFELASLLIEEADTLLVDQGTRQAYFEAARSIGSDFEMRRVYASALKRGPVSSPVLAGILAASQNIDSDFELASLLLQIAKLQPLDSATRGPFFSALDTVGSDFEHRRVLSALAERTDLTPETAAAMLASSAGIDSDFEVASFLLQIVKQHPIEGTLRAPFFRALDSIGSAFERGRVLQQVVRRADVSDETVLAALRATAGMSSGFEAGQVLLAVAAAHPVRGAARDAYIDAAEKLGDFEQGRALSALVRNERRK
jgi:beta-lactamase regulating signal transducer with metallopeptidase domain